MINIKEVLTHFNLKGEMTHAEKCRSGHINITYHVIYNDQDKKHDYIVQEINQNVFRDVNALMENIFNVTTFLCKKIAEEGGDTERETLHFIKTTDGKKYYLAPDGRAFRIYEFVENSASHDQGDTVLLYQSGRAFGRFQRRLSSFPADSLFETIPNFHNTSYRYENEFLPAVDEDVMDRAYGCGDEIKFVKERKDKFSHLADLQKKGEIPVRVTHNDTKLNNVIFDSNTDEAICVIDLDTVMPGLLLYDFGDSIRFGANTAAEDEKDLNKVSVNLKNFEAYARGFLMETKDTLTKAEIDNLAFSAWLMTMEVGMRFLTDYLAGDVYFQTKYEGHNLVRARNQLKLALDMEKHLDKMNDIIYSIVNQ